MSVKTVYRGATVKGSAGANHAPIYVDSDDNKLKFIPAGSGSTEVEIIDASSVQTLSNKTISGLTLTGSLIADGTDYIQYQVGGAPTNYTPISIGRFVSSAGTGGGFVMTSANSAAFRVYAEDGGANVGASATLRSILGRSLVSGSYQQEAEVFGVQGQFVINGATVDHNTAAVLGSWESQTAAPTITGTSLDHIHAGVVGRVGAGITATTVSATGVLAGVAAMSNVTSGNLTVTAGGTYAGLYVGQWSGTQDWNYGLVIEKGSVTQGVSVGRYSSTIGDGIPASGATWINGFFSDVAANLAAGVRRNVIARTYVDATQSTAASDYAVLRGHLKSKSGIDYTGDTSVRAAIHGYCEQAGATTVGAGSFFAPVLGELWSDGNLIGTGLAGALMARIYGSAGSAQTTVAGLVVCKQFSSVHTFTHGVYIQDGSVATGMDIRLAGGATFSSGSAAPSHNALNGSLYLRTGQTDAKAILYVNTSNGTGNTWVLLNTVIA